MNEYDLWDKGCLFRVIKITAEVIYGRTTTSFKIILRPSIKSKIQSTPFRMSEIVYNFFAAEISSLLITISKLK